ncbi:MAG: hypothetical protein A2854_01445 [Parcubacteria group bacterium RIFCSPHIGHO2_01_FULL_56_18]|nr:MAG: hypothetical protein A2854_01445 [Parcubacteria group bacterium RIFCSPHIGHO2_01_FULL_56_18]
MALLLLDNNLPPRIAEILTAFECVCVRDVLYSDATDSAIFNWCIANRTAIFVTEDKQFALRIASDTSSIKCILCTFGNLSIGRTLALFEQRKSAIEYFTKSGAKILRI